jgi:poly-gamma-glutamate synthesis protein (capsule biosynthesis protein)
MFFPLSRFYCTLFVLFAFLFLQSENLTAQKKESIKDETLSLVFVGDLMGHSSQFLYARQAEGGYNFEPYFEMVKPYLSEADFAIGNLETVLAGKTQNYSGYPQFNTPNAYADALKAAGFDLIVTTNNHSYDQLEAGVLRTLDELEKRKLTPIGTYRNEKAQDSLVIFTKKGISFALLAYTQFSNLPVPASKKYLVNHIEIEKITQDIKKAREKGAEIVIVHLHWGQEYQILPNDYQKETAQAIIAAGADIIVGGHPHVLQPIEKFKTQNGATLDSGLVAYSLGNFISAQYWRYSTAGVMLRLELTKKGDKISLSRIACVPTWVLGGQKYAPLKTYKVYPAGLEAHFSQNSPLAHWLTVPFAAELDLLTPALVRDMKEAYQDSQQILALHLKDQLQWDKWLKNPFFPIKVRTPTLYPLKAKENAGFLNIKPKEQSLLPVFQNQKKGRKGKR